MSDFKVADQYFDKNLASIYKLSILLARDGFSFVIQDVVRKKYVYFQNRKLEQSTESLSDDYYCQYFYDFLMEETLFRLPYKQVDVLYHTISSTIVPLSVYEPEKVEILFKRNFPDIDKEDIFSNRLKSTDSVILYAIPDCLNRILSRQFSHYKIYHQGSPLLEIALSESKQSAETAIFALIGDGMLDVVLVNDGELILYNQFGIISGNDIIFHIVNICNQFNKNVRPQVLYISGDYENDPSIIDGLEQYFIRVSSIRIGERTSISEAFRQVSLQKYSSLFNLEICG